jgi:hypothetical protein
VRILVTGSRTWDDREKVNEELTLVMVSLGYTSLRVAHGGCPTGADACAALWIASVVERWNVPVIEERYPAFWAEQGRAAGPRRNAAMVATKPDICLAFIKARSRGATHCARLALEAGIETHVWTAP